MSDFKDYRELWYPGVRSFDNRDGCIENLSCYRGIDGDNSSIEYDIERVIGWTTSEPIKLFPFKYSLMMNITLPQPFWGRKKKSNSSRETFENKVSQLKGFYFDKNVSRPEFILYRNQKHHDIFVDWAVDNDPSTITIGVIQDKELSSLDQVIGSLPYAVSVFNYLSPHGLDERIVDESIELARKNDLILPRNRLKECEAYRAARQARMFSNQIV